MRRGHAHGRSWSVLGRHGYGAYAIVHDCSSDAETRIVIALCGPIAENRFAGRPGATTPDGSDHLDWMHIAKLVSRYGVSAAGLDRLRRQARRLVKQNWATITKVAECLLEHQALLADEIDELVADQKFKWIWAFKMGRCRRRSPAMNDNMHQPLAELKRNFIAAAILFGVVIVGAAVVAELLTLFGRL